MNWTVETLNETVDAELRALPHDMRARFARIGQLIAAEYAIDPERLIEAVVVSPHSPNWLPEVVRAVLGKFGMDAVVEKSVLEQRPASEGTWVTVRNLKAYFAFRKGERPLRVWATSREHAFEEARERWRLKAADDSIDVWTEAECDEGYCELPNEYDRVASHNNNKHQNDLDPEEA